VDEPVRQAIKRLGKIKFNSDIRNLMDKLGDMDTSEEEIKDLLAEIDKMKEI
jgi:hypothetical protein